MQMPRYCLTVLVSAFCLLPSAFADWPRFRGPNGSGVAAGANTPATFADRDFNWKINLPGVGHSSPVVVGSKIFLTCGENDGSKKYLTCINLDTGEKLWTREYSGKGFKQHGDNSYASSSPTADDSRVYFTFTSADAYTVYCLDHAGKDVWSYEVGPWVSSHGQGPSPILVDDVLVIPNDQDGPTASAIGLNKVTGKELWKVPRPTTRNGAAKSTPCIYTPPGGSPQVILSSQAAGVSGLDPKTGKTLWNVPKAVSFRSVGSPVCTDSLVIATSGEGGNNRACVAIAPGESAKIVYKMPTGNSYPYVPTPVIKGDRMWLWSDVGTVTCLNVNTGDVIWQQKIAGTTYYSSPIIAGDKLYNITKRGEVICLSAGDAFKELGRSALNELCYATPAIVGDRLIIRTASHLISVGKK
jgi:outer membrane protein assembly factor BamB